MGLNILICWLFAALKIQYASIKWGVGLDHLCVHFLRQVVWNGQEEFRVLIPCPQKRFNFIFFCCIIVDKSFNPSESQFVMYKMGITTPNLKSYKCSHCIHHIKFWFVYSSVSELLEGRDCVSYLSPYLEYLMHTQQIKLINVCWIVLNQLCALLQFFDNRLNNTSFKFGWYGRWDHCLINIHPRLYP